MLTVVAAGCRLDVVAEVDVAADGSAVVGVAFYLDAALLDELDELGIDPAAELVAAAAADPDWTLDRTGDDDMVRIAVARPVSDAAGIGAAFHALTDGLAADDPALLVDVAVAVDADGAARLDGIVSLRPPATAGATLDGEPVGPSGTELARLVAEAVSSRLVVRLPGDIEVHDADAVDGATLTWQIPVGDERAVSAVAAPPQPLLVRLLPWGVAALVVIVAVVVVLRRRRIVR